MLETTLIATAADAVPVAFGFHPYLGLPGAPRDAWRLRLPAMRRASHGRARHSDRGEGGPLAGKDAVLGDRELRRWLRALRRTRGDCRIERCGLANHRGAAAGYRYAQVYAPRHGELIALEPMTAPTNALSPGAGCTSSRPGDRFRAAFRVVVATASELRCDSPRTRAHPLRRNVAPLRGGRADTCARLIPVKPCAAMPSTVQN